MFDGDYVSIQEIDSNGNEKLVAYITGKDAGPKSVAADSNWNKKTISISTNKIQIDFISDDFNYNKGFSANIYFIPIPNKECESWLNMDKKEFKSPNYPQTYHNSKKCSWLITIDHDNHITLEFIELYVRYQICNYNFLLRLEIYFYQSYFVIQLEADISFLTIYEGGSEQAEMIANLHGTMNGTKISTPKNQIFAVLNTNGNNNASIRLNAAVLESK